MLDHARMKEAAESAVLSYLGLRDIPGMAVALVHHRTPVLVRGFGCLDIRTQVSVTEHSTFHLASVSKTFVATEILILAQNGLIDIDRPVIDYLPSFALADLRFRDITVGQMLSHTSGLSHSDDSRWGLGPDDDGALARYVRSLSGLKLTWNPGEVFHYNNTCFEILGAMIAEVRRLGFEEAMRVDLLEPIGMIRSSFLPERVDRSQRACPHIRGGTAERWVPSSIYPYNRKHGPSSTLHASAQDLCRYLAALTGEDPRMLGAESLDLAFTPRVACGAERPGLHMGLSWFLGTHRGMPVRFHGGHDTGFTSRLVLAPDQGLGVAILCNGDDLDIAGLSMQLLDAALGDRSPA